ncbi:P-loop containing nucleoside triphosphate hydrolase protein [Boletus edulis BED1]|uniref:P-loop containing nucleoside triphosphate hydrolase protein n=1 Tax=Boletus edulis BED1 TaxID=1328754 RepID=A0AAD4GEK4_BOLED|nr:P-loop containing nucleoside triphosphate hydrolase protein [Boletus edulis BED1]
MARKGSPKPSPDVPLSSTRVIHQNLVDAGSDGRLEVVFIKMAGLNEDYGDLRSLVERNEGRPLGLSGAYLPDGNLQVLAIADATTVLLIDFAGDKNNGRANSSNPSLTTQGRDYLRDHVLGRTCGFVYAFDMAPLALALWQSHGLRIKQAIDVQSAGSPKTRAPYATIKLASDDKLNKDNITRTFNEFICQIPSDAARSPTTTPLAQRAWVAHYVAQLVFMEDRLQQVPPVDTFRLTEVVIYPSSLSSLFITDPSFQLLRFLTKSTVDSFRRDQLKPTEVTRSYSTSFDNGKKQLRAKADRFQNKIRENRNQTAHIHVSAHDGVGSFTVSGRISSAEGGIAQLQTDGLLAGKQVATITLMGRDDPTLAEVKRAQVILMILQGRINTDDADFNPWIQKIYLSPGEDFMWPAEWSQPTPSPVKLDPAKIPRPLNSSQKKAIRCMLDQTDSSRTTIIQGPPGTGKTTVIASYVLTAVSAGRSGIWLIAQSNVAVKNIAEKLADFGLTHWKLLVSDDFYVHWHEHLYTTIRANTISGGEFKDRLSELNNCPVVLCTLSMLSNNVLRVQGAFRRNPLHTVVIDEASQIEIGDYIPIFSNFTTIRKAIFIGDNMQLPPHGQDDIQELQSIFEVDHLTAQASTGKSPFIFLDTQLLDRMPPQIGDFIAQTVYPSESDSEDSPPLLKSSDYHPLANEESLLCYFVNVPGQQISQGTSWKNLEESKAIIQLASIFQDQGKNYRIITPYDAQRTLIEEELKKAELKWENKCFNVDSFQGNEEDYIVISLVRSRDLGFLEDKRRMNVMLSRCKRGMVIFTNKAYIEKYAGPGKSLIGELTHMWYDGEAWIEMGDLAKTHIV